MKSLDYMMDAEGRSLIGREDDRSQNAAFLEIIYSPIYSHSPPKAYRSRNLVG
jgi:hypothetical protein